MLIRKKYNSDSLCQLQGEWKDIARLFQELCVTERRKMANGVTMEQIKTRSLPIYTFLDCVDHIVNSVNNEFGAMAVRDLYDALDKDIPHANQQPQPDATEYEYCCNTFYERTVIFAAVYYVIAQQNPDLTEVLATLYKNADYEDARPYLNHFLFPLREKSQSDDTQDEQKRNLIPPHIIPDVQALNNGYRHLPPYERLRKFRQILFAIDALNPADHTPEIHVLRLTVDYAISILKKTYNLRENDFIPESEKVTIRDLISECANHVNRDQIIQFIENILNSKPPSEQDPLYHDMLNNLRTGSIIFNINGDYVAGDKYTGTVVKKVEEGGIGIQEIHE